VKKRLAAHFEDLGGPAPVARGLLENLLDLFLLRDCRRSAGNVGEAPGEIEAFGKLGSGEV